MNPFRIALANLRHPATADESVQLAIDAIGEASRQDARIVCFPECFVPGYRGMGHQPPPPDAAFLEQAWATIAMVAGLAGVAVVLGTERMESGTLLASALVVDSDGGVLGFQDKVQIDPSEEGTYSPGEGRRVFQTGPLTFGVAICHEGWRYPETVRAAARQGAQLVFHPHLSTAEPGDPANTFHQGAVLCRAAENTCYFASVNFASPGSPTTSAVARPDGTLLCDQPYGQEGLLVADIDLDEATGLLARRYKSVETGPLDGAPPFGRK